MMDNPSFSYDLKDRAAIVTGAAGAIGRGICRRLLESNCRVAATDLPGPDLDSMVAAYTEGYPGRIVGIGMDVTNSDQVSAAVSDCIRQFGRLDIAVVNAGVALVSSIEDMEIQDFRRVEKVNVEGTLIVLKELARHFKDMGVGGDIILISTKNVFAPGASFGAYSATKAAAHQLARVASLELAEVGVRVNMVAPDAVFSDGETRSGLWKEVGPGRMKARNLDESGLEEFYRNRNLLKTKITSEHVANAVLFFASRQTPTTGATIPVDGGLPDATPR